MILIKTKTSLFPSLGQGHEAVAGDGHSWYKTIVRLRVVASSNITAFYPQCPGPEPGLNGVIPG